MNKRRVFSTNTEVYMSNHIANVAQNAKEGKVIRIPIPQCGIPRTILEGTTSYMCFPEPPKTDCMMRRIPLYPYGLFYNIVPITKYVIIPQNCHCD